MGVLVGQAGYKGWSLGRLDNVQAIGPVLIRRELGDELVVEGASRGGEAVICLEAVTDLSGDSRRRAHAATVRGDIQTGLVERQRLDEIGVVGEDGADLL